MRTKLVLTLAIVAVGFFAIASGSALAAPGGKGGGGGKPGGKTPPATCTVSVTPNPATSGANFDIRATGFFAYQQVSIYADAAYGMFADANGNVKLTLVAGPVGLHGVTVSKLVSSSWSQCASMTYQVV